MEILFYICVFIAWQCFWKVFISPDHGLWMAVVHGILFIIGAFIIGPMFTGKANAAEIHTRDTLGEFIATLPGIKYPEWGDKDITFPAHCEGSYRTRLNCARMAWDKHNKGN